MFDKDLDDCKKNMNQIFYAKVKLVNLLVCSSYYLIKSTDIVNKSYYSLKKNFAGSLGALNRRFESAVAPTLSKTKLY